MDNIQTNSFWSTLELHCVCCGFEYEQYIEHCKEFSKGAPLSRKGYVMLGQLFSVEMEESFDIYT